MPWWGWFSVGILAIIALGFSCWYILSASDFVLFKKTINWKRFFSTHQALTEKEINDLKNIPIALLMVVGNFEHSNQEWKPLYLLPTINIEETINAWNQKIKIHYNDQISHPISDYLRQTNQGPNDIKFYFFRNYPNELLLNQNFSKLIIKTDLKHIGFNKLIR